jgi:uridine phosphorylase
MSMPNSARKYGDEAVIEPSRVIQERRKIGLQPSCPVPAGAILCYDAAFWQWVCAGPGYVECDGWLAGSYLVPRSGLWILVMRVPGFGAPTAVMTLEELAAFGIKKFVNLGTAGGLQQSLNAGDVVVCDRAIRDEGTSFHYLPVEEYAVPCPGLTENLCAAFERRDVQYRKGASWTTDAPYRETVDQLRRYRAAGVVTVEMEISALFTVGAYRGVGVSSALVISDLLSEESWHQAYHSAEKLEGLKRTFEVALEAIAMNSSTDRLAGEFND